MADDSGIEGPEDSRIDVGPPSARPRKPAASWPGQPSAGTSIPLNSTLQVRATWVLRTAKGKSGE